MRTTVFMRFTADMAPLSIAEEVDCPRHNPTMIVARKIVNDVPEARPGPDVSITGWGIS